MLVAAASSPWSAAQADARRHRSTWSCVAVSAVLLSDASLTAAVRTAPRRPPAVYLGPVGRPLPRRRLLGALPRPSSPSWP
ncbi:MAG: hypothetical protein MZV63_65505 [Marinilabiliales bacterium]|nr:hypothetical protein [Marinilabiliales bacterium]